MVLRSRVLVLVVVAAALVALALALVLARRTFEHAVAPELDAQRSSSVEVVRVLVVPASDAAVASEPATAERRSLAAAAAPAPAPFARLALRGRVQWPDGTPAAGARVVAEHRSEFRSLDVSVDTLAGADGRFEIGGLEAAPFEVLARAAAPDEHWGASVADAQPAGHELVLTLAPGVVVRGRVVDERGEPLERFVLSARRLADDPSEDASERAVPGDSGAFELLGLEAGRWMLVARAQGHATSEAVWIDVPGARDEVVLALARGARVRGVVVDSAGEPIAGASVELGSGHATGADEDGRFVLRSVDPGVVRVHASAPGFAPCEPIAIALAPGEEREDVVLALDGGATIVGVAVRPDCSSAAGQFVSLERVDAHFEERAQVGADGAFRFVSLATGRYAVALEPTAAESAATRDLERYDRARLELRSVVFVEVVAGRGVRIELGCGSGAPVRLEGSVRLGGEPLAHGEVHVERTDTDRFYSSYAVAYIDERGAFSADVDGPGEFVLLLFDGDGADVGQVRVRVPDVALHRVDVDVPAGSLEGVVVDSAREPLPNVLVEVSAGGLDFAVRSEWTSADGAWTLPSVPTGTYCVRASLVSEDDASEIGDPRAGRSVVVVRAGETTRVDLVLARQCGMLGRIVDASGRPVLDARVGSIDAGAWSDTDAEGRFRLEGLTAGVHVLRADKNECVARERVELAPGETREIELVLEPGVRLFVRGRRGATLLPIEATARDELGRSWSPAEYAASLVQELGPLPRGRYTVRATDFDGNVVERDIVAGERPELRVDLHFE